MNTFVNILSIIVFLTGLFIIPIRLYKRQSRGRFTFVERNNQLKQSHHYNFYALYQEGGFKSPRKHYIVHAFKTEEERNSWLYFMNNSNRRQNETSITYAVAITKDDERLKQALIDVKNNPVVYNNVDYINQRIYIEHNKFE